MEGEPPVHQQHDRVAQVDVVERVGDQDHRLALVRELSEEQHQRFLQSRVEAARGLVEEQQARLGEQLGRDRHPLALPSGKVVDGSVAPLAELQGGEDLVDATGSFLRRRVRGQTQAGRVLEALADRELAVDDVFLGHVAEPGLQGLEAAVEVGVVDQDLPFARPGEPRTARRARSTCPHPRARSAP